MNAAEGLTPEVTSLVKRRKETFGPTSMLFYERPLNLVRGEGVWLHDADGTRYLDAYNNVPSVGHCHPRVVEAVSLQMGTLNTHTVTFIPTSIPTQSVFSAPCRAPSRISFLPVRGAKAPTSPFASPRRDRGDWIYRHG